MLSRFRHPLASKTSILEALITSPYTPNSKVHPLYLLGGLPWPSYLTQQPPPQPGPPHLPASFYLPNTFHVPCHPRIFLLWLILPPAPPPQHPECQFHKGRSFLFTATFPELRPAADSQQALSTTRTVVSAAAHILIWPWKAPKGKVKDTRKSVRGRLYNDMGENTLL